MAAMPSYKRKGEDLTNNYGRTARSNVVRKTSIRHPEDPAYTHLMDGNLRAFNRLLERREIIDLSCANLAGADLRSIADIKRVILRGARLRNADLRGLDLGQHDLEGATINSAKVSGTGFPPTISANEIRLALEFGTRLRHDLKRPE